MNMRRRETAEMTKENKNRKIISAVLTFFLLAFFGLIFYTNLSCVPEYYNSDMLCDINYAREAWSAKSLFPDNWIFGNQLYVFATPVLATLIYGITSNAVIAMAIASCVMTVAVYLSFDWMLKPLCSYNERLGGFLMMIWFILVRRHIAADTLGAQIFFTMATFYAGYIIAAFMVFGCYVRIRKTAWKKADYIFLAVSLILSFALGVQSLRQTAIMTMPLVACEIVLIIIDSVRRKKLSLTKSTAFTAGIFVSNIAGLIAVKFLKINQKSIYGETKIELSVHRIIGNIVDNIINICKLFKSVNMPKIVSVIIAAAFVGLIVFGVVTGIINLAKTKCEDTTDFSVILLFLLGCASVFFIGVFTRVETREIYYFMVFPLVAVCSAFLLKSYPIKSTYFYIVFAVMFVGLMGLRTVTVCKEIRMGTDSENSSYQAAQYALDNGYECIFASFESGENVFVAADDKLPIVFYGNEADKDYFVPIDYLCVKDSYLKYDNEKTLYYMKERQIKSETEAAERLGVKVEKVAEFKDGSCLCRMSENVCALAQKQWDEKNSAVNAD